MRKVNKRFHELFLESLQGRGQPIPKVERRPILAEKEGMAPYFSAKVNLRETTRLQSEICVSFIGPEAQGLDGILSKIFDFVMPGPSLCAPRPGCGLKKGKPE